MARPKKTIEQPTQDVQQSTIEQTVEPTIHDKYRQLINEASSNYLSSYNYQDLIKILRWVEGKINNKYPINVSCGVCVIKLIQLFAKLEGK